MYFMFLATISYIGFIKFVVFNENLHKILNMRQTRVLSQKKATSFKEAACLLSSCSKKHHQLHTYTQKRTKKCLRQTWTQCFHHHATACLQPLEIECREQGHITGAPTAITNSRLCAAELNLASSPSTLELQLMILRPRVLETRYL